MDYFRPLYKLHRRGPVEVFDPLKDTIWQDYSVESQVVDASSLAESFEAFSTQAPATVNKITVPQLPGLIIYPQILTQEVQTQLIKQSTSEYLADPRHKTNLDAHMELERPIDIFRDAEMTSAQIQRKLRWATLGGQYNWTTKVYPSFQVGSDLCPEFPSQLGTFINKVFGIHADAAIVNYYSEGDILSPHQDVAELAKSDLISLSLGCECVFYIGLYRYDCKPLPILLRSGDVLVMGGESRWAYHGVGRVFDGTCPLNMDGDLGEYIKRKRININIRQMIDR